MSAKIHPSAIIAPEAKLAHDVQVDAYSVIEANVTIKMGTVIGTHCCIKAGTELGQHNILSTGVVLGGDPQDISFNRQLKSGVTIGDHNTFREFVTIHRSSQEDGKTTIGDHNLLMAHAHLGHDVTVCSHTTLANAVLVAGHAHIADEVFMSGHVGIHQYARIGRLAMLAGLMRVSLDVPPFVMAAGHDATFYGINSIGLRRAMIPKEAQSAIKACYREFYHSTSRAVFLQTYPGTSTWEKEILTFIKTSKRGVIKSKLMRSRKKDEESCGYLN